MLASFDPVFLIIKIGVFEAGWVYNVAPSAAAQAMRKLTS